MDRRLMLDRKWTLLFDNLRKAGRADFHPDIPYLPDRIRTHNLLLLATIQHRCHFLHIVRQSLNIYAPASPCMFRRPDSYHPNSRPVQFADRLSGLHPDFDIRDYLLHNIVPVPVCMIGADWLLCNLEFCRYYLPGSGFHLLVQSALI